MNLRRDFQIAKVKHEEHKQFMELYTSPHFANTPAKEKAARFLEASHQEVVRLQAQLDQSLSNIKDEWPRLQDGRVLANDSGTMPPTAHPEAELNRLWAYLEDETNRLWNYVDDVKEMTSKVLQGTVKERFEDLDQRSLKVEAALAAVESRLNALDNDESGSRKRPRLSQGAVETDEIRFKVGYIEANLDDLGPQVQDLQNDFKGYEKELGDLKEKAEAMELGMPKRDARVSSLQAQLEAEIRGLKEKSEEQDRGYKSLSGRVGTLEAGLEGAKSRVEADARERQQIQEQLKKSKAAEDQLAKTNEQLVKTNEQLAKRLEEQAAQNQQLLDRMSKVSLLPSGTGRCKL